MASTNISARVRRTGFFQSFTPNKQKTPSNNLHIMNVNSKEWVISNELNKTFQALLKIHDSANEVRSSNEIAANQLDSSVRIATEACAKILDLIKDK